jgi:hypothetical protein
MHAKNLQTKLTHEKGRVRHLAGSDKSPREIVTELYLTALGRFPTEVEVGKAAAAFSEPEATRPTATEDVLWALLNSPEFVFNH